MNALDKPLIGITVDCRPDPSNPKTRGKLELNWNYADEIARAGGVPLIIPPQAEMRRIATLIDGWLIPGGYDLDACVYGEVNHPKSELQDPARYEAETRLMAAIDEKLPVLGICYGCQALNVMAGGSLEQHMPDRLGHELHTHGEVQEYQIDEDSLLAQVGQGPSIQGGSYHHQAIGRVGRGLRATARHEDGTIEAIEGDGPRWLIGVQWHPERSPDDPASQRLFREFVNAAQEFRKRKAPNEVAC